ncbi:hypothetical protein SDR43_00010 [Ochrobactrum sp. BD61]
MLADPQLSIAIFEDQIAITAIWMVSVKMNNPDCLSIVKPNDEIVADLLVIRNCART